MARLILFNKPYRVLSQFSTADGKRTLADYLQIPGVYPAGRLDHDSEGLLLLTDDGALQARIAAPRHKLWKRYLVQVEGTPGPGALEALRAGIELADGRTRRAQAREIPAPELWPRTPPIRDRPGKPVCWLELALREGRNRQVRRMTAAVGLPTLRLVRVAVGDWTIEGLEPGKHRSLEINLPRPARRRR